MSGLEKQLRTHRAVVLERLARTCIRSVDVAKTVLGHSGLIEHQLPADDQNRIKLEAARAKVREGLSELRAVLDELAGRPT